MTADAGVVTGSGAGASSFTWAFPAGLLASLQASAAAADELAPTASVAVFAQVSLGGAAAGGPSGSSAAFSLVPPATPRLALLQPAAGVRWTLDPANFSTGGAGPPAISIAWAVSSVPVAFAALTFVTVELVWADAATGAESVAAQIAVGRVQPAGDSKDSVSWVPAVGAAGCSPFPAQAYSVRATLIVGGNIVFVARSPAVSLAVAAPPASLAAGALPLSAAYPLFATCEPVTVRWDALLASGAIDGSLVAAVYLQAVGGAAFEAGAALTLIGSGIAASSGGFAGSCCGADGATPLPFYSALDGSSVAGAQCAGGFLVLATFTSAADANGPVSLCSAAPLLAATGAAVVLAPESPPSLTVTAPSAGLTLSPLRPLSVNALLSGGTGQWRVAGALGVLSRSLAAPFSLSANITARLPPTLFPGTPALDARFVGEVLPGSLLRASPSGAADAALSLSWSPSAAQWAAASTVSPLRYLRLCVPLVPAASSSSADVILACGESAPFYSMTSGLIQVTDAGAGAGTGSGTSPIALPPWRVGEPIAVSWTYKALDASPSSRFDVMLRAPSGAVTRLLSAAPASSGAAGTGVAQGATSVTIPFTFSGLSLGLYDLLVSISGGDAGAPAGDTAGAGSGTATALSRLLLPPSVVFSLPSPTAPLNVLYPAAADTPQLAFAWTGGPGVAALRLKLTLCAARAQAASASAPAAAAAATAAVTVPLQPCVSLLSLDLDAGITAYSLQLPSPSAGLLAGVYFARLTSPLDAPSLSANSPPIAVAAPRTIVVAVGAPPSASAAAPALVLVAGNVLTVFFSTENVLASTLLQVFLVGLDVPVQLSGSAGTENIGIFSWPITLAPPSPSSVAAWPGSVTVGSSSPPTQPLLLFVLVCDVSVGSPVCGRSANFSIAPQPRVLVAHASALKVGASATISFAISGMTASAVSITLMASRYSYQGGDVSLAVLAASVPVAADGSGSVQVLVPAGTSTSSPVYCKVSAIGRGLFGLTQTVSLAPSSGGNGKSRRRRRLQAAAPADGSDWPTLLLRICQPAMAGGRPTDAGVPAALCVFDCEACTRGGFVWASLSAASLSFSPDDGEGGASFLGPEVALSQGAFVQLSAELGAFSASGVSACLPAAQDDPAAPFVLLANFSYARAITQLLLPAATGPPQATLTLTAGAATPFAASGLASAANGGVCPALLPAVLLTASVPSACAGALPRSVAAAVAGALGVLPSFVLLRGTATTMAAGGLAVDLVVQVPSAQQQAGAPSFAAVASAASSTLASALSTRLGSAADASCAVAVTSVLALSAAQQSSSSLASAAVSSAALTAPASLDGALALARSKRPLTGADESVLSSSALTDGTGAWSVQTAAARSTSSMRQSVFSAAKARLAAFFARFGLSLSQAAGIGAGVCLFLVAGVLLARRRWLQQRQLALTRRRTSLAHKQVLVLGAAKAGAAIAFDNPLLQRPREGRLQRAGGSVRFVLPPTPAAQAAAVRAARTSSKASSGRGRALVGALGLPVPADIAGRQGKGRGER